MTRLCKAGSLTLVQHIWATSKVVTLQGGLARSKGIYPENWPVSCWQVDNPAGTFIATRSLAKPVKGAALTPSGVK